jgi:hypothetical protein
VHEEVSVYVSASSATRCGSVQTLSQECSCVRAHIVPCCTYMLNGCSVLSDCIDYECYNACTNARIQAQSIAEQNICVALADAPIYIRECITSNRSSCNIEVRTLCQNVGN